MHSRSISPRPRHYRPWSSQARSPSTEFLPNHRRNFYHQASFSMSLPSPSPSPPTRGKRDHFTPALQSESLLPSVEFTKWTQTHPPPYHTVAANNEAWFFKEEKEKESEKNKGSYTILPTVSTTDKIPDGVNETEYCFPNQSLVANNCSKSKRLRMDLPGGRNLRRVRASVSHTLIRSRPKSSFCR